MHARLEEILQFRKYLIQIENNLDLQVSTLFHGFLTETTESLQLHQIKIMEKNKT